MIVAVRHRRDGEMPRVTITQIELENCGPWGGHHVFELPSRGLSVLIAPNEAGKTTLLRCVAAILWGYQPPAPHWYSAPGTTHKGMLYFTREEGSSPSGGHVKQFRVYRDFQSGETSAAQARADGSWRNVFRGRARHGSKTPEKQAWSKFVSHSFAPITAEAFSHIALIAQPWPHRLDPRIIQEFIIGTGQATIDGVRENLVRRYRSLSRFTNKAGLHTHDGRNPGELDLVEEDIRQLQDRIRSCQQMSEQLEKLRRQQAELEAEREHLQRQYDVLVGQCQAVEKSQALRRELAPVEELAQNLEQASVRIQLLTQSLKEKQMELASWPAPLNNATSQELRTWQRQLIEWREKCSQLLPFESLHQERSKIDHEFAVVAHFPPDAPIIIDQYLQLVGQVERLRQILVQQESKVAQLAPRVDRRRQQTAAIVGGAGAGFIVMLLIMAVMFALGLLASGSGTFIVGFTAAILAAAVGAAASWLILRKYRPMLSPPGYEQAAAELARTSEALHQTHQRLAEAATKIAFVGTTDPTELARATERFRFYQQQVAQWEQAFARRKELDELLSPTRLPLPIQALLNLAGNDVKYAENQLQRILALRSEVETCQQQIASILTHFGCQNAEELERRKAETVDRRQNLRRELDNLAHASPVVAALLGEAPQVAGQKYQELLHQVQEVQDRLNELFRKREDLQKEIARCEAASAEYADFNIAQAEDYLEELKHRKSRLQTRAEAVKIAFEILKRAENSFASLHLQALEDRINNLMRQWTEKADRFFRVTSRFDLSLHVPREPNSAINDAAMLKVDLSVLSQGTWDQLALAVRIAVLDRVAGAVELPLLIDDVFLTWDLSRRELFRKGLETLLPERQIILVSHDPYFESWGKPIQHRVHQGNTLRDEPFRPLS